MVTGKDEDLSRRQKTGFRKSCLLDAFSAVANETLSCGNYFIRRLLTPPTMKSTTSSLASSNSSVRFCQMMNW